MWKFSLWFYFHELLSIKTLRNLELVQNPFPLVWNQSLTTCGLIHGQCHLTLQEREVLHYMRWKAIFSEIKTPRNLFLWFWHDFTKIPEYTAVRLTLIPEEVPIDEAKSCETAQQCKLANFTLRLGIPNNTASLVAYVAQQAICDSSTTAFYTQTNISHPDRFYQVKLVSPNQ